MGPDPINADPRVLTAMSAQLIRQYDLAMTAYKTETMEPYSGVFRTANQATRLVDWHLYSGSERTRDLEPADG